MFLSRYFSKFFTRQLNRWLTAHATSDQRQVLETCLLKVFQLYNALCKVLSGWLYCRTLRRFFSSLRTCCCCWRRKRRRSAAPIRPTADIRTVDTSISRRAARGQRIRLTAKTATGRSSSKERQHRVARCRTRRSGASWTSFRRRRLRGVR
jgi:hypothetical protein